jgi:hypothetical protein
MMTANDIKTMNDLKEDGYYWMANTSDTESGWAIAWLVKEELEDDDGTLYYEWEFSAGPEEYSVVIDEDEEDWVFMGPLEIPDVPIPIASPRRVAVQALPVRDAVPTALPPLARVPYSPSTVQWVKPALVPLKR